MKKVQFGSGLNILDGWENTDFPKVDVTKPLAYQNSSVDRIFHEHMLEHIDEVDGFKFLKECYRILKPGGIMRIVVPSIDGIIYAYQNWELLSDELKSKYRNKTHWINSVTYGEAVGYSGKIFTKDWNIQQIKNGGQWHRFLYDKEDLKAKLLTIGFTQIKFVEKHQSDDIHLQKLERRYGGKFAFRCDKVDINLEAIK